jgi:hypothetical protein
MKIAIGLALALALALSSVPATAGDTFYAFSSMVALEQTSLTPLPDDQLAAIEGAKKSITQICQTCSNTQAAVVTQSNSAIGSSSVEQSNEASVDQSQSINTVNFN